MRPGVLIHKKKKNSPAVASARLFHFGVDTTATEVFILPAAFGYISSPVIWTEIFIVKSELCWLL